MDNDKIFVDGILFKTPSDITKEKAPWVRGHLAFKVDEAIAFLTKHKKSDGWVNVDLKKSKEKGTLYLELNTYEKKPKVEEGEVDTNDIPF